MAGGTFTAQNKVRPGSYFDFLTSGTVGALGARGIVAIALALSWGASKTVIEINVGNNLKTLLGYDVTDSKLLLVNEALKRAKNFYYTV